MSVFKVIWGVQKFFLKEYLVFAFVFFVFVDIWSAGFDIVGILASLSVTAFFVIILDIIILAMLFVWHLIRCVFKDYRSNYYSASIDKKIRILVSPIEFLSVF